MVGNPARGGTVTALAGGERTLGAAIDAFLAQPRPARAAHAAHPISSVTLIGKWRWLSAMWRGWWSAVKSS